MIKFYTKYSFLIIFSLLSSSIFADNIDNYGFGRITTYGANDKLVHFNNLKFYTADIIGFRFKLKSKINNPFTHNKNLDDISKFSILKQELPINGIKIIGKEFNLIDLGHDPIPYTPAYYEAIIFIKLPDAMKNGIAYTFSSKLYSFKTRKIIWSDKHILSESIKVNQIAYNLKATANYAFLGKWLGSYGALKFSNINKFEVIDINTNKSIYCGTPILRHIAGQKNETPYNMDLTGENLYLLNISSIKKTGCYYITIPDIGRSYSFKISKNALSEPLFTSIRMLYHNRCGIAIKSQYTPWIRNKCLKHCSLIMTPEYYPNINGNNDFKNIKKFIDANKKNLKFKKVMGGYHDAGDYDRRNMHLRIPIMLAFTYEGNTKAFVDNQFIIPESGNKIPDILDEAYFGLLFYLQTQWSDGGIPAGSETYGHPKMKDSDNGWLANVDNEATDYILLPVTQESSIKFAVAAAQLGFLFKKFPAAQHKSQQLITAAQKAYHLAIKKFKPTDNVQKAWFAAAATQLLRATDNKKFADDVVKYQPKKYDFMNLPFAIFATSYITLPEKTPNINRKLQQKLKIEFQKTILNAIQSYISKEGYIAFRHPMAPIMNGTASGAQSYPLALAYIATKNPKMKEIMNLTANTALGANAPGLVFATGIGQKHILHPLHLDSMNDALKESVPGCWIYGPSSKRIHWLEKKAKMFPTKLQRPRAYRFFDIDQCPMQTEFTVWENIAPMVMLFGLLAPKKPLPYYAPLPSTLKINKSK